MRTRTDERQHAAGARTVSTATLTTQLMARGCATRSWRALPLTRGAPGWSRGVHPALHPSGDPTLVGLPDYTTAAQPSSPSHQAPTGRRRPGQTRAASLGTSWHPRCAPGRHRDRRACRQRRSAPSTCRPSRPARRPPQPRRTTPRSAVPIGARVACTVNIWSATTTVVCLPGNWPTRSPRRRCGRNTWRTSSWGRWRPGAAARHLPARRRTPCVSTSAPTQVSARTRATRPRRGVVRIGCVAADELIGCTTRGQEVGSATRARMAPEGLWHARDGAGPLPRPAPGVCATGAARQTCSPGCGLLGRWSRAGEAPTTGARRELAAGAGRDRGAAAATVQAPFERPPVRHEVAVGRAAGRPARHSSSRRTSSLRLVTIAPPRSSRRRIVQAPAALERPAEQWPRGTRSRPAPRPAHAGAVVGASPPEHPTAQQSPARGTRPCPGCAGAHTPGAVGERTTPSSRVPQTFARMRARVATATSAPRRRTPDQLVSGHAPDPHTPRASVAPVAGPLTWVGALYSRRCRRRAGRPRSRAPPHLPRMKSSRCSCRRRLATSSPVPWAGRHPSCPDHDCHPGTPPLAQPMGTCRSTACLGSWWWPPRRPKVAGRGRRTRRCRAPRRRSRCRRASAQQAGRQDCPSDAARPAPASTTSTAPVGRTRRPCAAGGLVLEDRQHVESSRDGCSAG